MSATTLLLFCSASILLAITPGPTMLLALTTGIAAGTRVALFGILGASLASALLIAAVAFGLGALLAASEELFALLRGVGVAYLVWIGLKLWKQAPSSVFHAQDHGTGSKPTARAAFARSALVALSNPKAILFFAAFLPQFTEPGTPQAAQYLVLGAVFVSVDASVMLLYAVGGTRLAALLSTRGLRAVHRGCAGAMFALAGLLAAARRGGS